MHMNIWVLKGMDRVRIIHIEHKSGSVEPVQYIELRPTHAQINK